VPSPSGAFWIDGKWALLGMEVEQWDQDTCLHLPCSWMSACKHHFLALLLPRQLHQLFIARTCALFIASRGSWLRLHYLG
jgi:hypothetical protein